MGEALKINLGCCDRPIPGYLNVDLFPYAGVDQIVDLRQEWPWGDSTVDEFKALDVLEHLQSPTHSMNQIWRTLKPGGRIEIAVPTTDGRGWAQDPTHICMPPWNRNSFFYFTHGDPHNSRFYHNGVKAGFRVIAESEEELRDNVSKLTILLEAVKE